MAARRCGLCGINYPPRNDFKVCPVHGEDTAYFSDLEEHEHWAWQATALMARISPERASDVSGALPVVAVEITKDEEGRHWISSLALIRLGLQKRLVADDVIEIPRHEPPKTTDHPCDCLWQVVAYRDSSRSYWISPLRVPSYVGE